MMSLDHARSLHGAKPMGLTADHLFEHHVHPPTGLDRGRGPGLHLGTQT